MSKKSGAQKGNCSKIFANPGIARAMLPVVRSLNYLFPAVFANGRRHCIEVLQASRTYH